ncbi:MAG: TIGR03087 family PEP-CTERM/XrtA system glycosyltransferase [Nitrosomonas ureae]
MKVLLVCHRLPFPPTDGARIRSFNILKHLSKRHSVTVAAPVRSAAEFEAAKELGQHCQEVLVAPILQLAAISRMVFRLFTSIPSSMGYFYSPQLYRLVRSAINGEQFDLVIAFCSAIAPYVADIRGPAKLLDFVDMDSQKWLHIARVKPFPIAFGYWLEGSKLQRAETLLADKFDACTCITPAEMETLRNFGVNVLTDWFPNGVDLDYFAPDGNDYRPESIVFTGRMDYFPNQQGVTWFCQEVLPLIRASRPQVTMTIVGAEPPYSIRALAEIPGVVVTGTVPDVRPYVQAATLAVVPLKIARGTQNKILESFALGVPVVCTSIAAVGIEAEPGEHFLVADSTDHFARVVSQLLVDPIERSRLAAAARSLVESRYSWQAAMAKLDTIIEVCLARFEQAKITVSSH